MSIFLTRGRIAVFTISCLLLFSLLLEPVVLPWFIEKAPLGGWLASEALFRADSVGYRAYRLVISGLVSENPQVVDNAIEASARLKIKRAVPLLFKLVSIGKPATSKKALAALMEITGNDGLSSALSPEERRRVGILIAEILIPGQQGKVAFFKLSGIGLNAVPMVVDELQRMKGARSYTKAIAPMFDFLAGVGGGFRPELVLHFLHRPCHEELRASLERALTSLGKDVIPYLQAELHSKVFRRFASAANVLVAIDAKLAARYLSSLIIDGIELTHSMRKKVYTALGRCPHKESYDALVMAARYESETELRVAAIQALVRCPDERVVPTLLKLSEDTNGAVRKAAYRSLYQRKTPESHKALAEKYVSSTEEERSSEIGEILKEGTGRENQ